MRTQRYLLAVLVSVFTVGPALSQPLQADLELESEIHPQAFKHMLKTVPAFKRITDEAAARASAEPATTNLFLDATASPEVYLLTEQLSQTWDAGAGGGQGDWMNEGRVFYVRDDNGLTLELHSEDWDGVTQEFVPNFRRSYMRDDEGQVVLDESWNPELNAGAGDWEPAQRFTYTYNGQGNLLTSLTEYWDDDAQEFRIIYRSTYTYDGSGERVMQRIFESALFGDLAPSIRHTFMYDGDGNETSDLTESYDTGTSAWSNLGLDLTTYDDNGEVVEELSRDWDLAANGGQGDWVNGNRTITMYTPNSVAPDVVDEIDQNWDAAANGGAGDWLNVDRNLQTATPNASNPTLFEDLDQTWDAAANGGQGDWVNESRDVTTIEDLQPIESVGQTWDAAANGGQGDWVNESRDTVGYDGNGLVVSSLTEGWNGAGWVNQQLLTMMYEEYGSSTATEQDGVAQTYKLESNYPNPFSEVTTIDFSLPESDNVTLELFDMLGRRVSTLVDGRFTPGTHEVTLNAARLPGGMYVYRLRTDRFQSSRTMMVVR